MTPKEIKEANGLLERYTKLKRWLAMRPSRVEITMYRKLEDGSADNQKVVIHPNDPLAKAFKDLIMSEWGGEFDTTQLRLLELGVDIDV